MESKPAPQTSKVPTPDMVRVQLWDDISPIIEMISKAIEAAQTRFVIHVDPKKQLALLLAAEEVRKAGWYVQLNADLGKEDKVTVRITPASVEK